MPQAELAATVGLRSRIVDIAPGPGTRAAHTRVWLALVAFAIAAALPFFPPPATALLPPEPGASLLARLFPGVDAAWVLTRLGAILTATLLAASALPRQLPLGVSVHRSDETVASTPGIWLALVLALAHLASAWLVPHLGRTGQGVYVLAGFVPGGVLWATSRRHASGRTLPAEARVPFAAIATLVAAWLLLCVPRAWHAPGVADSIDTWLNFGWISATLTDQSNLLTTGPQPGLTNLHLVFLGVPLLGPGRLPFSLGWIQGVQAAGVATCGLLIASILTRLVGRGAAVVATAAFLFSPFTLALPYVPTAFAMPCCLILWALWLALRLRTHTSGAALALLGALGGIATTIPQMVPFALVAGVMTVVFWFRGPKLPLAAWGVATASFLALALPGLPTPATFQAMREAYLAMCAQWAGLEGVLLGQRSPYDVPSVWDLWYAGRPGRFDIALGTLLAPFATPRTALRLWADVYLEPLTGCLFAVGVAQCLRAIGRDRRAAMLLAVLVVAILPGFTSAYDRASLTRPIGLPLVATLFVGIGFEAVRRMLLPQARVRLVSAATALAIALSGLVLFQVVNPRLLARSSMGIVLRVLEAGPPANALVFGYGERDDFDWLHVERIARYAPREPLPSRRYEGPESLLSPTGLDRPVADVLFYSPALDQDRSITREVCSRWPGSALFTFLDEAGLSRALAARPAGSGWTPNLPHERWKSKRCNEG